MSGRFILVLFSLVFLFGFAFATDLSGCQDITFSNDDYVITTPWLDNDSTCFRITAQNITLDCNGSTLNYTGPGTALHARLMTIVLEMNFA